MKGKTYMASKDTLGDRMKNYYEEVSKTRLTRRTPVIIRLDGKAFHTFLKGFKKPFDNIMVQTMQETMKYLCENIQGCVLGYTQSDEITLVLVDYQNLDSSAWFDYEVQKLVSVSASMATLAFNRYLSRNVNNYILESNTGFGPQSMDIQLKEKTYQETLKKAVEKGAMFDARAFNIPKEEVTNCVLWRQLDAERNSVNSVAQATFSQKELQGISSRDLIVKLEEKNIIWNSLPTTLKRGSCCIKQHEITLPDGQKIIMEDINEIHNIEYNGQDGYFYKDGDSFYFYYVTYPEVEGTKLDVKEHSSWVIDNDIPKFIKADRDYIDRLVNVVTEEL